MLQKPKGTRDFFGNDSIKIDSIHNKFANLSKNYGFEHIIFPTFELKDLFVRSTGEESDIVTKEIYEFKDKGNRLLALRPEGTASTLRLALENHLIQRGELKRFFYFEPMFRYERPQKGRQREFYQFGVEVFNDNSIQTEVELILLASTMLSSFKIDARLEINTLGSIESRKKYNKSLINHLKQFESELSEDSKIRLQTNPLRILDSKDEGDQKLLEKAPKIWDFLTQEEKIKFEKLQIFLEQQNIAFVFNPKLVRGLDYYNDLVFEFISNQTNLSLIGGGRYDNLVNQFEPKLNIPSIGFGIGIERILEEFEDNNLFKNEYYLATTSPSKLNEMLVFASKLRLRGYNVKVNYMNFNYKNFYKKALEDEYKVLLVFKDDSHIIATNLKTQNSYEFNIY